MKVDIIKSSNTIKNKNAPLLLIDTCSLLDVLRVPFRQSPKLSHLIGAKEILQRLKTNVLSVVITDLIEQEYLQNVNQTIEELMRFIENLNKNNERLLNVVESVGLANTLKVSNIDNKKLNSALKSISNGIIDNCIILEKDNDCILKAHERMILFNAPSARGKSESKDCVIIEHFLKLIRRLRNEGYSEKIAFSSSNSKDYGDAPKIKSPLDVDFNDLGIDYCNDFNWALSMI